MTVLIGKLSDSDIQSVTLEANSEVCLEVVKGKLQYIYLTIPELEEILRNAKRLIILETT